VGVGKPNTLLFATEIIQNYNPLNLINYEKLIIPTLSIVLLFSCGNNDNQPAETKSTEKNTSMIEKEQTYQLNTQESFVTWKGTILGVYSHEGNLKFKSGFLTYNGNNITGGKFIVDMTSIEPTDDNYSEEHPKEKLITHLSSEDFFDTQNYPVATFEIIQHEGNSITGNLTIRGITHQEKVTDVNISVKDETIQASGKLTFDRQKYGVSYQNQTNDMVLSDDIELSLHIIANR